MSAYLLCLSISGGIPLFTRKNGDLKSIPFPLLASLNGVAMFGQSHDCTLLSTVTRECRLVWRDYHNSVRLIVAVPLDSVSEFHIHRLLDNIFQCLVLVTGLDDLIALRNIDRVKRELRAAYRHQALTLPLTGISFWSSQELKASMLMAGGEA